MHPSNIQSSLPPLSVVVHRRVSFPPLRIHYVYLQAFESVVVVVLTVCNSVVAVAVDVDIVYMMAVDM
jgi:hypothetical protein